MTGIGAAGREKGTGTETNGGEREEDGGGTRKGEITGSTNTGKGEIATGCINCDL